MIIGGLMMDGNTNELYSRQDKLDINTPKTVTIIGCGGVGSWVAFDFALTGVKHIILIDYDKVEMSNLNRTPFKLSNVGQYKTEALSELIAERRRDVKISCINKQIEDCNSYEMSIVKNTDVIIDCRDNSNTMEQDIMEKANIITGGYDGSSVTIDINREIKKIWGDEPVTYTITPSWLIPPQFIANMITLYVCCPSCWIEDDRTYTFDMKEIFKMFGEYNGKANK
jgi:molybdopterin/thiamine biosynthesis adenylyltransferase